MSRIQYAIIAAGSAGLAIVLLLPTFIVIPMSFSDGNLLEFPPRHWSLKWWLLLPHARAWMNAIRVSVSLSVVTSVVAVMIAALAAQATTMAGPRLRSMIHGTLLLPLVVPSILMATGLFFAFARLFINGTFGALLVGHLLVATPAAYLLLRPAIAGFDRDQYRAALCLGAHPLLAWRLVVAPQLRVSFLAAALLAFLASLDEVIISVFVGGGENTTVTKVMFESLRDRIDPMTAVVSSAWTILVVVVLGIIQIVAPHAWSARPGDRNNAGESH